MLTKRQVLDAANRGEGTLGKAADDEPVFVLRAQDALAADLVETWALRAGLIAPVTGAEGMGHKVGEAHQIAQSMREWSPQRNPT